MQSPHQLSANEMRKHLACNIYQWNTIRKLPPVTPVEDLPGFSAKKNRLPRFPDDISSQDEIELFQTLAPFFIDEMFFYFAECLHSKCVGATISIEECRSKTQPADHEPVRKDNNDLILSIAIHIEALSYTPMTYTFASENQRHRFYSYLSRTAVSLLQELGYEVIARDSWRRGIGKMSELYLEGQIAMNAVSLIVRWASDEYANKIEHLRYPHQIAALERGISIDDILCGEKLPPAPKLS